MKYYIAENGQQAGPFEPNELLMHGLTVNSLVWCEGMPSWTSASQVPELMALLSGQTFNPGNAGPQLPQMPPMGEVQLPQVPPFGGQPQQPTTTGTPYGTPNQPYAPPQYGPSNNQPQNMMPKTWLTESILVTVGSLLCCFNWVGIATGVFAIFKAFNVKSKFAKGDTAGATKDSSMARLFMIITIVIGLVSFAFQAYRLMTNPELLQQIQEGTFGTLYGF